MEGFFGIGIAELFFIAILALIVLGPQRLPGALREGAKWLRQLRSITSQLTAEFSKELSALEDLDPRRIVKEVVDQTKPAAAAKPASPANASTAAKPPVATPAAKPVNVPATATPAATAPPATAPAANSGQTTPPTTEPAAPDKSAAAENRIMPLPASATSAAVDQSGSDKTDAITSAPAVALSATSNGRVDPASDVTEDAQ